MINYILAGIAVAVVLFSTFLAGGYWIVGVIVRDIKRYGDCRLDGKVFTMQSKEADQ